MTGIGAVDLRLLWVCQRGPGSGGGPDIAENGGLVAAGSLSHQERFRAARHPTSVINQVVGKIRLGTEASSLESLEHQFWSRMLMIADFNDDRQLQIDEFLTLMRVRLGRGHFFALVHGNADQPPKSPAHLHHQPAISKAWQLSADLT